MNELDGFIVFRPEVDRPAFISTRQKSTGLSSGAWVKLGKPEYVNFFFDENGRRVMIKVAESDFDNALKVVFHGKGKNMCFGNKMLAVKLIKMFGLGKQISGHLAGEGIMIFEEINNGRIS